MKKEAGTTEKQSIILGTIGALVIVGILAGGIYLIHRLPLMLPKSGPDAQVVNLVTKANDHDKVTCATQGNAWVCRAKSPTALISWTNPGQYTTTTYWAQDAAPKLGPDCSATTSADAYTVLCAGTGTATMQTNKITIWLGRTLQPTP